MESGAYESSLTLSIDLELDIEQQTEARRQRLDEIRGELVAMLERRQLPATWAVADPAISAATEPILASSVGHEIAVLADRTWFGPGAGRMRLRRELSRRFERARRVGIPVSTLVLRNVSELSDIDLLVEHGIDAIRGPGSERLEGQAAPRSFSRADIWHLPAVQRYPVVSAWWLPQNWAIKRQIRQSLRKHSAMHLAIDTPRLVDSDAASLVALADLLDWLVAARESQHVCIATLGTLGRQHLAQHMATPSRSILRPAA